MDAPFVGYQAVIAATDFSDDSSRALSRAVWVAERGGKRLVAAHVISDLKKAVHRTSYRARIEFLEGKEDHFQRELRRDADEKLKRQIAALGAKGLEIRYETLLGDACDELIHSVQQEGYDLVVAGTRGHSTIKHLVLGSTAKKLVHKCPAPVWIVKNKEIKPPRSILVAVDLSDVSRRALNQAIWTAQQAGSSLHVVHVVESTGLPSSLLDEQVPGHEAKPLREVIASEAAGQLDQLLSQTVLGSVTVTRHVAWGTPAQEISRLAKELSTDLIVLGTVGRRGFEGLLLGNTAESVLTHCECDVLTVKPAEFVSPVKPATWQLHPGPKTN